MDFQLFSYAVMALMVVMIVVLFYGANVSWKRGSQGTAVVYVILAVICAIGTYSIYGDQIRTFLGIVK